MGDLRPLAGGGLGRPDVHAAVDLHRVGADALAAEGEPPGQSDRQVGLAAGGGTQDQDDGQIVGHENKVGMW
jgi:hypothetical protein